jgi:hypothetical protein
MHYSLSFFQEIIMSDTPKPPEQILFEAMGNGDWETEAEEVQGYYRSYVAAIRPQIEAGARAVAIEDAVSACKAEFLIEPNKNDDGDLSYDLAVSHCIEAIKTIAHN